MVLATCGIPCVIGLVTSLGMVGICKIMYANQIEKDARARIARLVENKPF